MKTSHAKYIIFIIAIILIMVAGVFIFEQKTEAPTTNSLDFDGYVRNESWQTDYTGFTPYRLGDTLEYIYVFPGGENALFSFDINTLLRSLKDAIIELNWKSVTPEQLAQIDSKWQTQVLTIRGKASTDSSGINTDAKGLIFIKKIPNTAVSNETLSWSTNTGVNTTIPEISASGLSLSATHFSSNENEVLFVSGSGVSTLTQVIIGDVRFPLHMDKERAFTLIDKGTFQSGTYFVSFVQNTGKLISLDSGISFSYDSSPIRISWITPNTLSKSKYGYVVLQGTGFKKLVSLQLGNGRIFKKADYKIVDDMVVIVTIPTELAEGTYYFNMMDTSGIYTAKIPITITQ